MSLVGVGTHRIGVGFPRPRGDEPLTTIASVTLTVFSPPTRG